MSTKTIASGIFLVALTSTALADPAASPSMHRRSHAVRRTHASTAAKALPPAALALEQPAILAPGRYISVVPSIIVQVPSPVDPGCIISAPEVPTTRVIQPPVTFVPLQH